MAPRDRILVSVNPGISLLHTLSKQHFGIQHMIPEFTLVADGWAKIDEHIWKHK